MEDSLVSFFHSFLVLQILLIVASVVAITVYRLAAFFAFSTKLRAQDLKQLETLKDYVTPQMATSVTASIISFVVIMILNILYERVAIWITNFGEFSPGEPPSVARFPGPLTAVSPVWRRRRAAEDQDGLREQPHPEDVPLPVRQLLLLLLLHRLLQREGRRLPRGPRLPPGKVPQ